MVGCSHWFPASPVKLVGLGDTVFLKGKTKPVCFSVVCYHPEREQPWPTGLHGSRAQQEPGSPVRVLTCTYASAFSKGRVITYPHSFSSDAVSEKHFIILAKHLYSNVQERGGERKLSENWLFWSLLLAPNKEGSCPWAASAQGSLNLPILKNPLTKCINNIILQTARRAGKTLSVSA